jgi:hypothetical protein
MATVEEILKNSKNRKKTSIAPEFIPEKRRAWDFMFEDRVNGNKIVTIKEQNSNKAETKIEQNKDNVSTNKEQNKDESKNKYRNNKQTNFQIKNIVSKKTIDEQKNTVPTISYGIQNKILRNIISHIKNQPNKNYTVDIPINILAKKINASKESVRVSIKRLQKKNHLIRMTGEKGRYGITKVKIPEFIVKKYFNLFDDIPVSLSTYDNNLNSEQYRNINGNEYGNTFPISSSYLYKTTTENSLSIEWRNVDIEPLKKFNFTENHLVQIATEFKLQPKVVQNSIYAFAFDMENNNKGKEIDTTPVNFFMGILRKVGVYTPPRGYESPQARCMRLYEERMRQEEEIENKAINLAFKNWFKNLTDEQKKEYAPESSVQPICLKSAMEAEAKEFFKEKFWSSIKDKIISGEKT